MIRKAYKTYQRYVPTKLNTLIYALCTISFALLISSCSIINEDLEICEPAVKPDNSFIEIDLSGYVGFRFKISDNKTRAGETPLPGHGTFDDGEELEYGITNEADHHFIVFYNSTGNISVLPLHLKDPQKHDQNNITLVANSLIVSSEILTSTDLDLTKKDKVEELIKNGGVPFTLLNFDKSNVNKTTDIVPSNFDSNVSFLSSLTKSQFLGLTLSNHYITAKNVSGEDTDYFTMSISRNGYGESDFAYTMKTDNYVFETAGEAEDKPAGSIYVERVSSKFTVDLKLAGLVAGSKNSEVIYTYNPGPKINLYNAQEGIKIDESSYTISNDPIDWEIEILGYGMNALEPSTLLIKKQTNKSDLFSDAANFRTYWSEDPHYFISGNTAKYPMQFRRALETSVINVKHKGGYADGKININDLNESFLSYYSFNYFKSKKGDRYTFENTYDDNNDELGDRGYFSAGTHLIMVARVSKIGNSENDGDLYMDQNNIFYTNEEQILGSKLEILNKVILNQANNGFHVLDTDWKAHRSINDNYTHTINWADYSNLWIKPANENEARKVVIADLQFIEAELSGGDGQLLIAPKDKNDATKFYLAPEAENEKINSEVAKEIDYNHVVSLFHKVMGAIDHFKNGYLYYPAAIPHFKTEDESYERQSDRPGDFGVVRNNWYEIEVTQINGVGRPVDNPDQPIIPNLDVKRDYLNIAVKIIDWHEITESLPESKL